MDEEQSVYLVQVKVNLLGGGVEVAIDAIESVDSTQAKRVAMNSIILAGDNQAVTFGDRTFLPGVVASLTVDIIGVIDKSHPDNASWLYSIEMWKEFERSLEQDLKKKPRKEAPIFSKEPPA